MDDQSDPFAQIPAEVRVFLESIIQDAGMNNLDEEMHRQMMLELYKRLDTFMLATIVDKLPKEKVNEFTKMAGSGKTREELEQYLRENVENAVDVFASSMLDFRDLYLGSVEAAQDQAEGNNTQS